MKRIAVFLIVAAALLTTGQVQPAESAATPEDCIRNFYRWYVTNLVANRVHINPIVRHGVPKTAPEILNRINEISFNSSLMREMRAIAFVTRLISQKKLKASEMKQMLIHSIRDDELMTAHSVASKLSPDWQFLCGLKDSGCSVTERWLRANFDAIGERSSVDLEAEFL